MVSVQNELDVIRYFLEEAHRRAGDLTRGRGSNLSFGQECHSALTSLIRKLGQAEEEIRRSLEDTKAIPVDKLPKECRCHTVSGE